jgi:hypothetical protein
VRFDGNGATHVEPGDGDELGQLPEREAVLVEGQSGGRRRGVGTPTGPTAAKGADVRDRQDQESARTEHPRGLDEEGLRTLPAMLNDPEGQIRVVGAGGAVDGQGVAVADGKPGFRLPDELDQSRRALDPLHPIPALNQGSHPEPGPAARFQVEPGRVELMQQQCAERVAAQVPLPGRVVVAGDHPALPVFEPGFWSRLRSVPGEPAALDDLDPSRPAGAATRLAS